MNTLLARKLLALLSLLVLSCSAAAGPISVVYQNLGGDRYLASYRVDNDLSVPITNFVIDYAPTEFASLQLEGSPANWDLFVDNPNIGLDLEGILDAFALNTSIQPGQSLAGFQVSFDYFGAGMPGATPFTVFDEAFNEIAAGSVTVPGPAAFGLTLFGLALLNLRRRLRRRRLLASHG